MHSVWFSTNDRPFCNRNIGGLDFERLRDVVEFVVICQ